MTNEGVDTALDIFIEPVASDSSSNGLVWALDYGICGGFINGLIWTSIVTPGRFAIKNSQTFRQAWRSTLPRRANGIIKWTALTTLILFEVGSLEPYNNERKALRAAERRGEIADLKMAFGEQNFEKFQDAPAFETVFYTGAAISGLSIIAATRSPTSALSSWLRRRSISRTKGVMFGAGLGGWLSINLIWVYLSGGFRSRSRLSRIRRQEWKDPHTPEHTVGDNYRWLVRYRAARDGEMGNDRFNDDPFDSGNADDKNKWGDEKPVDDISYRNASDPVKPDVSNSFVNESFISEDGNRTSGEEDK